MVNSRFSSSEDPVFTSRAPSSGTFDRLGELETHRAFSDYLDGLQARAYHLARFAPASERITPAALALYNGILHEARRQGALTLQLSRRELACLGGCSDSALTGETETSVGLLDRLEQAALLSRQALPSGPGRKGTIRLDGLLSDTSNTDVLSR